MKPGFSLVEALLASALFALLVTGLAGGFLFSTEGAFIVGERNRGIFLAEEGLEAVRAIRGDRGFPALLAGTYGLLAEAERWQLSGSEEVIGSYRRQVTIADLNRRTKEIRATVSWPAASPAPRSVSLTTQLTYWTNPVGNWENPRVAFRHDLGGGQDPLKIEYFPEPGGSRSFFGIVRQSDSDNFSSLYLGEQNQPITAFTQSITTNPTDISLFDRLSDDAEVAQYLAITARNNKGELEVLDVHDPNQPSVASTFNAPGEADGLAVMTGPNGRTTVAYLLRERSNEEELIIVDLSEVAEPRRLAGLELRDSGNDLVVLGPTAFIASAGSDRELQVVALDQPSLSQPRLLLNHDLGGVSPALAIAGFETSSRTIIAIGRENGELLIFDVSNRSAPQRLATFNAGGAIYDLAVEPSQTYLFLATANVSREFQVVDIFDPSQPSLVGSADLPEPAQGVTYAIRNDLVLVISNANDQEIVVITPQ